MPARFRCPYLGADVELADERELHITEGHPDLLPEHRDRIRDTLADPDEVRRSARFTNARLFSRWFGTLGGGKHVVVVVINDPVPTRYWIVTAYVARRLAGGELEWARN